MDKNNFIRIIQIYIYFFLSNIMNVILSNKTGKVKKEKSPNKNRVGNNQSLYLHFHLKIFIAYIYHLFNVTINKKLSFTFPLLIVRPKAIIIWNAKVD